MQLGGARKKLAAAALHWLGERRKPAPQPAQVDDSVAAGLRRMGVSEDDIAAHVEQQRAAQAVPLQPDFEVHEDCWKNWQFFMTVQRQWVYVPISAGMGVSAMRWSLNWSGVRAMVMLRRVPEAEWDALIDDLLAIEWAVLVAEAEMNKESAT